MSTDPYRDDGSVDEPPTVPVNQPWVGSAAIPETQHPPAPRPRRPDDTLDLPVVERQALEEPPPPYVPPPFVQQPVAPQPPAPRPTRQPGYPPPGYPPSGPPPAPGWSPQGEARQRRRRRRPLRLLVSAILVLLCCGVPVRMAKPYFEQWPASVAAGAEVSGLTATESSTRSERAETLLDEIDKWYYRDSFATIYVDSSDSSQLVTAFGITRFLFTMDNGRAIDNALADLSDELSLTGLHTVDVGDRGGEARCGSGSIEDQALLVCGWADHGSLGVVMFTNREESDCVLVVANVRRAVIRR